MIIFYQFITQKLFGKPKKGVAMHLTIKKYWKNWWNWLEFCNSHEYFPDTIVIENQPGHYWSWKCVKCGQTSSNMSWPQVEPPNDIICDVDKKCKGVMEPYLYLPQKEEVTILKLEDCLNNWWKICDPFDLFQMQSGSRSITKEALAGC